MKIVLKFVLACIAMLLISACNSGAERFSTLKKCTVLGDESIIYARAHYVKLFYHFNPNKFSDSYKQISSFDSVTHRNTIDTYFRAVDKISTDKLEIEDQITQNLISACKKLSTFSLQFVEESYRIAINHISKNDPLTDNFFIEINSIVKFDHNIGEYDKTKVSFRQSVDDYYKAVGDYINRYRKDIPSEFVRLRNLK